MPQRASKHRAIIFDLFDTLVLFNPQKVPTTVVNGQTIRSTAPISFQVFQQHYPTISFPQYQEALGTVSTDIAREREETLREIHSEERFRRLFVRLGITDGNETLEQRQAVMLAHMHALGAATECPAQHRELLTQLREHGYILGVLSNFDHTPTAQKLLHNYGLAKFFAVIAISADLGWRKPKLAVFLHVIERLGIRPEEGLFVGDSWTADVLGSAAVGLTPVWVNRKGQPIPDDAPSALQVITSLGGLRIEA
jgi:HAD superfamily hydrolase (TIGR01549 family)